MRAPIQLDPLGTRFGVRTSVGIFIFIFLSFEVEVVQPRGQLVLLILLRRGRGLMELVFRGAFDNLVQPLHDGSPFLDARSVVVQNGSGRQNGESLLVRYPRKLQKRSGQFPFL